MLSEKEWKRLSAEIGCSVPKSRDTYIFIPKGKRIWNEEGPVRISQVVFLIEDVRPFMERFGISVDSFFTCHDELGWPGGSEVVLRGHIEPQIPCGTSTGER